MELRVHAQAAKYNNRENVSLYVVVSIFHYVYQLYKADTTSVVIQNKLAFLEITAHLVKPVDLEMPMVTTAVRATVSAKPAQEAKLVILGTVLTEEVNAPL